MGSRECRHNSSGCPRRAVVSVSAFDIVFFGGGLLQKFYNDEIIILLYIKTFIIFMNFLS